MAHFPGSCSTVIWTLGESVGQENTVRGSYCIPVGACLCPQRAHGIPLLWIRLNSSDEAKIIITALHPSSLLGKGLEGHSFTRVSSLLFLPGALPMMSTFILHLASMRRQLQFSCPVHPAVAGSSLHCTTSSPALQHYSPSCNRVCGLPRTLAALTREATFLNASQCPRLVGLRHCVSPGSRTPGH